jgi:outer membrane protein
MNKLILVILIIILINSSKADTVLGVDVGVQQWFYDYSGDISQDTDPNPIDLENTLGFGNETSTSAYISIEHPIPFVPNFKLKHSQFSNSGFNSDNQLTSKIILDHTDLTLYYELLDNWVNLDLGFSLIYFDGGLFQDTGSLQVANNYSEIIPTLYGKARFDFPITDLSASVTINASNYSENSFFDAEISAQYKLGLGFDVEAGIRRKNLDIDELNIDTSASGVFAGINFHF